MDRSILFGTTDVGIHADIRAALRGLSSASDNSQLKKDGLLAKPSAVLGAEAPVGTEPQAVPAEPFLMAS